MQEIQANLQKLSALFGNIVEKYVKRCFICGKASTKYTVVNGKRICDDCKAKINEVDLVEEFADEEEILD
jgi:hypothetical protein